MLKHASQLVFGIQETRFEEVWNLSLQNDNNKGQRFPKHQIPNNSVAIRTTVSVQPSYKLHCSIFSGFEEGKFDKHSVQNIASKFKQNPSKPPNKSAVLLKNLWANLA